MLIGMLINPLLKIYFSYRRANKVNGKRGFCVLLIVKRKITTREKKKNELIRIIILVRLCVTRTYVHRFFTAVGTMTRVARHSELSFQV